MIWGVCHSIFKLKSRVTDHSYAPFQNIIIFLLIAIFDKKNEFKIKSSIECLYKK